MKRLTISSLNKLSKEWRKLHEDKPTVVGLYKWAEEKGYKLTETDMRVLCLYCMYIGEADCIFRLTFEAATEIP